MLHAKIKECMASGYGEDDFSKVFPNTGRWTTSIHFLFLLPTKDPFEIWLQLAISEIFKNGGQMKDGSSIGIL